MGMNKKETVRMKENGRQGNQYRLPKSLTPFQERMYIHLIDRKWRSTSEPGYYKGIPYDAILPESRVKTGDLPHLYSDIKETLKKHQENNDFRIHKHFYHMASSQAANINLFLPILHHQNADAIFHAIRPDFNTLAKDHLDHGYCIEYWGGNACQKRDTAGNSDLLHDKTATSGTDADLAIAYRNHAGELCLWLIEHKLTEREFTPCGGSKSRGRQTRHDCGKSFSELVRNPAPCYYHDVNKYAYWKISQKHQDVYLNHDSFTGCPFRGGMNQLWRNQLLGFAIEDSEAFPYTHVAFSVVHHPENKMLNKTLEAYKRLINHNPKFSSFTSLDVIKAAEACADERLQAWITWYKDLYNL